MKVRVVTPTYKCFDLAMFACYYAMHGSKRPDEFIVIDNSGTGKALEYFEPIYTYDYGKDVYILPQIVNLGVARSWNLALSMYEDFVVLINDDVELHQHTLERLVNAAIENEDEVFFHGDGASGNSFSCFLLKKRGWLEVGPFDERFYPAYYEDNDYAYRLKLKGYNLVEVKGATYNHVGSATLKSYTVEEQMQHHRNFDRLGQYYRSKWGGMPGYELFDTAFNRKD